MGLHEYRQSLEIASEDRPFYALIMAAMRQADTRNAERLQTAFPEVWNELEARYWASEGVLEGD